MKKLLAFLCGLSLLAPWNHLEAQQATFNQRAAVSFNSSGSNTVISAVAGQTIAIYGLDLYCASAVTVQLKDGSTNLTGAIPVTTNATNYVKPVMDAPAYWTLTLGNAFNISLGSGVACAGAVWYTQQ